MNININGADQTPRKRLVVFEFLRKDVDESTTHSIEADIVKVRTGFKDLNKAIWQSKIDYARDFANVTLIAQQKIALSLINTTTTTGESTEYKIIKLQQASEQAKTLINSELEIAQAKILEAKKLALLNGEKPEDLAEIEAEANLHLTALNLTAQEQVIIVEQALNDSIAEVEANDDGKRFAIKDADGSLNLSSGNITAAGIFSPNNEIKIGTPIINQQVNMNGTARYSFKNTDSGDNSNTLFSVSNDLGYLFSFGITSSNYFSVPNNRSFANQPSIGQSSFNDMYFVNGRYTGFSWLNNPLNDSSNLVQYLMSLDRKGNLNVSGNITAIYFIGDGSLLTGISSNSTNLTNYALKNQSETFAGNITTSQTGFFGFLGSL